MPSPKRLFGCRGLGQVQCFVRCYYRQIRTKPDSARFQLGLARCTRQHSDGHENDREGDGRRPSLVVARAALGLSELPTLSCVARAACRTLDLVAIPLRPGQFRNARQVGDDGVCNVAEAPRVIAAVGSDQVEGFVNGSAAGLSDDTFGLLDDDPAV
jgi:hypothetical protein